MTTPAPIDTTEVQRLMVEARNEIQARFEAGSISFSKADITYAGTSVLRTETYTDGSVLQFAGLAGTADPTEPDGEGMVLWSVTSAPVYRPGTLPEQPRKFGPLIPEDGSNAALAWEQGRDVLFGLLRNHHKTQRLHLDYVPDSLVATMKDSRSCKAILASVIGEGRAANPVGVVQPRLRKEAPMIPLPPNFTEENDLREALLACLISPEIEVHTDQTLPPWKVLVGIATEANVQKFRAGTVASVVLRCLGGAMDGAYEHEQQSDAREQAAKQAFARPTRKMSI